jgi:hypothetical protein
MGSAAKHQHLRLRRMPNQHGQQATYLCCKLGSQAQHMLPLDKSDPSCPACAADVVQASEDGSRLSSLQEQVMALSQQVQMLQPLQPKLSTTEVERDTALHKVERLQVGIADHV